MPIWAVSTPSAAAASSLESRHLSEDHEACPRICVHVLPRLPSHSSRAGNGTSDLHRQPVTVFNVLPKPSNCKTVTREESSNLVRAQHLARSTDLNANLAAPCRLTRLRDKLSWADWRAPSPSRESDCTEFERGEAADSSPASDGIELLSLGIKEGGQPLESIDKSRAGTVEHLTAVHQSHALALHSSELAEPS